jgi:phospholipid/cholesterol/gamma-HCH transport system substrate-binding protein
MAAKRQSRWYQKPVVLGALFLTFVLVALFSVYQKERIGTWLSSGEEVKAEFPRAYRLVENKSDVKMAGVVVGTVTGVEKGPGGRSIVSAKVDEDAAQKLGSAPSATIRPTTLLGGNYYLQLEQGGVHQPYDGQTIPANRTHVPAELDQVLAAIPNRAQDSIRNTSRLTDEALSNGAGDALGKVLEHSPGTLRPAGGVLQAAQGTRPQQDLYRLVPDLNSTAVALTDQRGQLGRIVDSMANVSGTMSSAAPSLADTFDTLPDTLSETKTGLGSLQGSLDKLNSTATASRPAIQQLGPLLAKADPVVRDARPLMAELRPLLNETKPTFDDLVPTAKGASETLGEIKGPVLDRLRGPVTNMVMSPWKGTGAYSGDGGNGHLFYEELGYLAAHTANLSQYRNKNGPMLGLGLGAGVSSVGGNDPGTAKLLQGLGLLPGGSLNLLPPPDKSNDKFTPETPTAPGPLGNLLPGLLGGSEPKGN